MLYAVKSQCTLCCMELLDDIKKYPRLYVTSALSHSMHCEPGSYKF